MEYQLKDSSRVFSASGMTTRRYVISTFLFCFDRMGEIFSLKINVGL